LSKGKSFVTLYTDFSFKQLKKNAVAAKGKSFRSLVSKGVEKIPLLKRFPLTA